MLCLLSTSRGNDMPRGTVQHTGWLAISVIIKSSFDTGSVPENPLSVSPPSASVHSFIPRAALLWRTLETVSQGCLRHHPIIWQQKAAGPHKPLASCVERLGTSFPTPIKSNSSLNKKSYTIFAQTNYDERQWRQGLLI